MNRLNYITDFKATALATLLAMHKMFGVMPGDSGVLPEAVKDCKRWEGIRDAVRYQRNTEGKE